MTKNLSIKNFKSIKSLQLDCKRVNVFIGEPNSGKSNIIEALGLFSSNALVENVFQQLFRFKTMADFFYDSNINENAEIRTDKLESIISYPKNKNGALLNEFLININPLSEENMMVNAEPFSQNLDFTGKYKGSRGFFETDFRFYEFKRIKSFERSFFPFLSPPYGENLPGILQTNNEIKKWVSEFLREKKYRLQLRPLENDINISKEVDDELYSYPYFTISETLQRVIFMHTAIETNKDAVLLFDEPESNTFPFYTKYIAERIGLSDSNQFFITTHNPYLLLNIIQKTPSIDLNICITRMEDYQTKVYPLNELHIEKVLEYDADVFDNLERVIEL